MRYVDDMLWFGPDSVTLHAQVAELAARLGPFGLQLHPRKTRIAPTATGADFVGIVATHRTLRMRGATKRRSLRYLAQARRDRRRSTLDDEAYLTRLRSFTALAEEARATGLLSARGLLWP